MSEPESPGSIIDTQPIAAVMKSHTQKIKLMPPKSSRDLPAEASGLANVSIIISRRAAAKKSQFRLCIPSPLARLNMAGRLPSTRPMKQKFRIIG